jgi:putative DNA primase/helicase
MDAGLERPEEREFQRNPFKIVMGNRATYVWAALTVVRAYIVAGKPGRLKGFSAEPFDDWSELVRSSLVWLGRVDPVLSQRAVRAADPRRQARLALLAAMLNAYGSEPREAAEIIKDAETGSIRAIGEARPGVFEGPVARNAKAEALKSALVEVAGHGRSIEPKWLGTRLRQYANNPTDGLALRSSRNDHTKVQSWYVEAVTDRKAEDGRV